MYFYEKKPLNLDFNTLKIILKSQKKKFNQKKINLSISNSLVFTCVLLKQKKYSGDFR